MNKFRQKNSILNSKCSLVKKSGIVGSTTFMMNAANRCINKNRELLFWDRRAYGTDILYRERCVTQHHSLSLGIIASASLPRCPQPILHKWTRLSPVRPVTCNIRLIVVVCIYAPGSSEPVLPYFTFFSVHIAFQRAHVSRYPRSPCTFLASLEQVVRLHDKNMAQALDQETKQLKTATTEHANEHAGNQTRPNANRNASLSEVSWAPASSKG